MVCVKKKKRNIGRRICVAVAIILVLAVLSLSYMNAELDEILSEVAYRQLQNMVTQIINESVAEVMELPQYKDGNFVTVTRSSDNSIRSVTANSVLINRVRADITNRIAERVGLLAEYAVPVSYENIFNDAFIFSLLPKMTIDVTVEPFGAVNSSVESRFVDAGINQTNHIVEMDIDVRVAGLLLEAIIDVEVSTNVCLAETVIVGDVPNVWLGTSNS